MPFISSLTNVALLSLVYRYNLLENNETKSEDQIKSNFKIFERDSVCKVTSVHYLSLHKYNFFITFQIGSLILSNYRFLRFWCKTYG